MKKAIPYVLTALVAVALLGWYIHSQTIQMFASMTFPIEAIAQTTK